MTEPTPSNAQHDPRGAALELLTLAAGLGLGLLVAAFFLLRAFIPQVGFPGDLDRVASLPSLISETRATPNRVQFISNSVGMEGIDAGIVQDRLAGTWNVQNYSSNGVALVGSRVVIGAMLEAKPDVIVWILLPNMIGKFEDIHPELAATMRFVDLQEHNPWIEDPSVSTLLPDLVHHMKVSDVENRLGLRTTPLSVLNDKVRTLTVRDILPAKPRDLTAPFRMSRSMSPSALDRHVLDIRNSHFERIADGDRSGIEMINQTVQEISAARVKPVVVIAPSHDRLRSDLAPAVNEMREVLGPLMAANGGFLIDASESLAAEDFADAIHPNAAGRERLSVFVGEALAAGLRERTGEP